MNTLPPCSVLLWKRGDNNVGLLSTVVVAMTPLILLSLLVAWIGLFLSFWAVLYGSAEWEEQTTAEI